MRKTLKLYNKVSKYPFGKKIFGFSICLNARYFFSIRPKIIDIKSNYVAIRIKKRRAVTNHINTVHAIAMCNMAEFAGGLMTEVSVNDNSRWIPSGMTVKYLKKAKTDLTAISDGTEIDWNHEGEIYVPVVIKDTNDEIVFTAEITMNIKHS